MTYHFKMTDREKFETICDLTTNAVGLHKGALADKTRKETIHKQRMVASLVGMLIHDIHPITIADVLNRDRTTILHYQRSHKYNYASFPDYRDLFNRVYNMRNQTINLKKKFTSKQSLIMLLVNSGINISNKKTQVYVKIKSGDVVYKLKTNYLDCTENIKIIEDVLKDYNYTLEIKTI